MTPRLRSVLASSATTAASAYWAMAGLFVVSASLYVSPDAHGALAATLGLLMLAVAESDARSFVVPDVFTIPAFALGLADAGIAEGAGGVETACASAFFAALAFLALRLGYRALRGRDGVGLGDVKLAAVAGAWLGVATTPAAIELAALAALAIYLIRQRRRGRAFRFAARLPFGAFFAPAIWIVGWIESVLGWL